MKLDVRDVFNPLEPPPGGLLRLRERLRHEKPRLPYGGLLRVAGVACLVMAVAASLLWFSGLPGYLHSGRDDARSLLVQRASTDMHPFLVKLGLADPPSEPVSVPEAKRDRMAVHRVNLDRDDVVFYLVASAEVPKKK